MSQPCSKCVVCAVTFRNSVPSGSSSRNSRFANRKLLQIFCQHFNLSNELTKGFDFCIKCKNQVRRLCLLERRLGVTQSEITKIVAHLTLTIIETESDGNSQKDDSNSVNIEFAYKKTLRVDSEDLAEIGSTGDHLPKFTRESQNARKMIYEQYQPHIVLTPCGNCNIPLVNTKRKRKCVKPLNLYSLLSDDEEWDGDDDAWEDPSTSSALGHEMVNSVFDNNNKKDGDITITKNDTVHNTSKELDGGLEVSFKVKKFSKLDRKIRKREANVDQKRISVKERKKKCSSFRFKKQINSTSNTTQRAKVRMQKLIRQGEHSFVYGAWSLEQDPITQYYKCLTCGKSRKSRGDIIRHINVKHNTERTTCELCGKSWENPKRLNDHDCRPKSEDKRRKCKILPHGQFVYIKKWAFEKVKKDDDSDTTYKCHTCDSVTPSLSQMYAHLSQRHENPNKFVCDICGRHYALKSTFMAHQTIHNESRDIICHICGKNFRTKNVLAAHMQGHQDKRWTCEICGKSFKYSKGLGKHRRDVLHFKRNDNSQPQESQPQQHLNLNETQQLVGIQIIEKADAPTTTTTVPTDYTLSHLIFHERERLHAEFTQSLRNLPF